MSVLLLVFSSLTPNSGIASLKWSSYWPLIVTQKENYAGPTTNFWNHLKYYFVFFALGNVLIQIIKFFKNAFPISLRTYLHNLDAHLFLMCCGDIFRVEEMYKQYVDLAQTCVCPFSFNATNLTQLLQQDILKYHWVPKWDRPEALPHQALCNLLVW